jgi:hypothetical protein
MTSPRGYYAAWKEGSGEMAIYRMVWVDMGPRSADAPGSREVPTNFFTTTESDMERELMRRNCSGDITPPTKGMLS